MGLYVLLDRIPKTCKLLSVTMLTQGKVSYSSQMGFDANLTVAGRDQPVHMPSLISIFVIHLMDTGIKFSTC